MVKDGFGLTAGVSRSARLGTSASAIALGLLMLTACNKGNPNGAPQNLTQNTTAAAPDSPASKCSSPEALATVKGIVIDEAKSKFAVDQAKKVLNDPAFLDRIDIENVVVQAVDQSVNKVTCQASLKLDIPEQYKKSFEGALSINNSLAQNPGSLGSAAPDAIPDDLMQDGGYAITYTAQPEASKDGLYYSLSDVDPIAHGVGLLATTMEASATSASSVGEESSSASPSRLSLFLPTMVGQPYAKVRESLIQNGISPIPFVQPAGDCQTGVKNDMCRTYNEFVSCNYQPDIPYCTFLYKDPKDNSYIEVIASGNNANDLTVKSADVDDGGELNQTLMMMTPGNAIYKKEKQCVKTGENCLSN